MSQGNEKLALQCEHGEHFEHEVTGETEEFEEHHHEDDPHVWLSASALKIQIKNILEALKKEFPNHGDEFVANHESLFQEIDALEKELKRNMVLSSEGKTIVLTNEKIKIKYLHAT